MKNKIFNDGQWRQVNNEPASLRCQQHSSQHIGKLNATN